MKKEVKTPEAIYSEAHGLGVGDEPCPDCHPTDGCEKHYILNGDRHDKSPEAILREAYDKAYATVKANLDAATKEEA